LTPFRPKRRQLDKERFGLPKPYSGTFSTWIYRVLTTQSDVVLARARPRGSTAVCRSDSKLSTSRPSSGPNISLASSADCGFLASCLSNLCVDGCIVSILNLLWKFSPDCFLSRCLDHCLQLGREVTSFDLPSMFRYSSTCESTAVPGTTTYTY
jgi:hypothetical protein